jgi:hypothetical protein
VRPVAAVAKLDTDFDVLMVVVRWEGRRISLYFNMLALIWGGNGGVRSLNTLSLSSY